MWSDRLSTKEVEFTEEAIKALEDVKWAGPLLKRLQVSGGITSGNKPLMFEVRFAFELHRAGVTAEYEYNAGVGDSTVEFRIFGEHEWLIELVSIRASEAAKKAIRQTGLIYEQLLSSKNTNNPAQSPEAELITAEQKIGEKVFSDGKPTKFPIPEKPFHMIISDIRGYLDHGGDIFDYRQMAYGASGIPSQHSWMIHYWKGSSGILEPVKGLYEESNPLRAAPYIQQRIHFLGFIWESEYREGEILDIAHYLANWHLFENQREADHAFQKYPLRK